MKSMTWKNKVQVISTPKKITNIYQFYYNYSNNSHIVFHVEGNEIERIYFLGQSYYLHTTLLQLMKTIAKELYTRVKERELESNYLPDPLKYLEKWIIHSSGYACFEHLLSPIYNTCRTLWLSPTICNTCRPFVVVLYYLQQFFSPYKVQPSSLPHCHCHLLATIVLW